MPWALVRRPAVLTRLVGMAAALDVRVAVWTVDDAPTMRHLLDAGVGAVVTDPPDVLREVLLARGEWLPAPVRRPRRARRQPRDTRSVTSSKARRSSSRASAGCSGQGRSSSRCGSPSRLEAGDEAAAGPGAARLVEAHDDVAGAVVGELDRLDDDALGLDRQQRGERLVPAPATVRAGRLSR